MSLKKTNYNGFRGEYNFLKLSYQNMLFSPNVIPGKTDAMCGL
ncbi:Uncharacterized protein dnm_036220 [Desulfonema magnum]|uniref:Uncharacterized protein n=1 Tax=Desulfonema magnum TaxID=45655 RepID=A0A975BLW9_9BACT|nr:Uncharacterized protein dnm_036220 [Desulfonema magnum]